MAWNVIDDQITREFAFIQQLVWSPPYRNPFPSCTKMIISDLKALNTSLRSVRHSIFSQREAGKASKLAATAKILDSDALKLIEFRTSYCKKLLQFELLAGEKYKLSDLENKVDIVLVQHIKQAWQNDVDSEEFVSWMTPAKEIDFAVLDMAVNQIFESFQQENNINLETLRNLKGKERNSRGRGGNFDWDEPPQTARGSCSPQFLSADENEEDETLYNSGDYSTSKSSILETNDTPEILISDKNAIKLQEDNFCISQFNTSKSSEAEIPINSQLGPKYASSLSDHSDLEVEMVMKSRLRRDPENKDAYIWHIMFGLINHGSFQIEVNSLSFWRIDGSARRSGSDVCSIKWPKGHVILLEGPSFLCYRTKFPCSQGCFDSPRVAFSWKYRKLAKKLTAQREDVNQTSTTECESSTEKEARKFPDDNREDVKIGGVNTPMYKRLGSLMFEWSATPFKRRKS